ncbi:hypothetical protein K505DRAFT_326069 [Melanomma pulvis-pyrius CBS 109.77]|uniref:Uncharacterized protein n=1 Tax=Melanomma pulvis-pyrius CBS 109.77 TaxID=1314802 RepID=A0A6A6X8C6_9PLEO|nr:hypothetical protein K505DRAFT_326069 [Melanomma pulvis-pyrius CBS 109.77]
MVQIALGMPSSKRDVPIDAHHYNKIARNMQPSTGEELTTTNPPPFSIFLPSLLSHPNTSPPDAQVRPSPHPPTPQAIIPKQTSRPTHPATQPPSHVLTAPSQHSTAPIQSNPIQSAQRTIKSPVPEPVPNLTKVRTSKSFSPRWQRGDGVC